MRYFVLFIFFAFILSACNEVSSNQHSSQFAADSFIMPDSTGADYPVIRERIETIRKALLESNPVIRLKGLDANQLKAQEIAIAAAEVNARFRDEKSGEAFRNEVFNVYAARPQEIPQGAIPANIYRVEVYNFAKNFTTTVLVDIGKSSVLNVTVLPESQPDIPTHLKDLAIKIAVNNPEVI